MVDTALSSRQWQEGITTAIGHVDRIDGKFAVGWAHDSAQPDEPIDIEIRAYGSVLGVGVANEFRAGLARAGFGSGAHGFRIEINVPFVSGQCVELALFDAKTDGPIAANPFMLNCRDPHALQATELDINGVQGLAARRVSKRRRRFNALATPVVKSIRKIRQRRIDTNPVALPGVQAKLSRVDNALVTAPDMLAHWPGMSLPRPDSWTTDRPKISVIIPVYNQFHLTYQCLTSLILSSDKASFEVLVVDDRSTDATSNIESRVNNLRIVRNEKNLGFLQSCNKAASMALGEYLVFLNNDTEVEAGWLDEMVGVFDRFSQVGAVGAKLVYPDGRLQDAGGIVWETGVPWNVGHGRDPQDPEFNYVREVDYLTGAALMVSRPAWDAAGGFSEAYKPAYYEDTDLAFKLRSKGYRTLYCPQATVIHYEGRSNGTDVTAGLKQHQVSNAEHFKATWKEAFVGQGEEGKYLIKNKDRNRGLRVLMIDNSFPRLGQDAGSYAAVQELKILLALGCKVTFLPHNLLHLGVHVDALQRLGVECVHAPFHRSIPKFLERRAAEFDVVYVTRYSVADNIIDLVRQHSNAKIVFNNADLHFLREMRTARANGETDLSGPENTRRRELKVMSSVDVVLSYNEFEHEVIASHLMRDDHIFKCPWVLYPKPCAVEPSQRNGLAFLGGFGHPPNRQAVDWFLSHVMPLLRIKRPDLTFHIWGSGIPDDTNWEQMPGVVVEGYAESLDQVFNTCYAFVAPLLAGAGIKGKVLDSIAYGVPTVLSPTAAEATGLIHDSSTLIANSPEQWIMQIERLLDDQALWRRISDASIEIRDTQYSLEHGITQMAKVFNHLSLDTTISDQQVVGL